MEVITKTFIEDIYDLKDLCWSGALYRINEVIDMGIEEEFMNYLEEMFFDNDNIEDVDLNDFIWFECDEWIDEHNPDRNTPDEEEVEIEE